MFRGSNYRLDRMWRHLKRVKKDPEIFPLVGIVGCALIMSILSGARMVLKNPDVKLLKSERLKGFQSFTKEQGEKWIQHRKQLAHLYKNPINSTEGSI